MLWYLLGGIFGGPSEKSLLVPDVWYAGSLPEPGLGERLEVIP